MNSRLTPGGQNLSKRQTVLFMSVDPMNKKHRDPDEIDLNAPRLAWYKQEVWKKPSKNGVSGRHQTCSKEKISVLSSTIERNHPLRHASSLLYPEGYQDGNWRNQIREYLRHFDHPKRFPFKIIG